MSMAYLKLTIPVAMIGLLPATPAAADTFFFSTGNPDGKIATLSRTASPGKLETETADDFVTTRPTVITSATFTGLLVGGATPANISDVEIELYHVFPVEFDRSPGWQGDHAHEFAVRQQLRRRG